MEDKHPVPKQDVEILGQEVLAFVMASFEDRVYDAAGEAGIELPEMTANQRKAFDAAVLNHMADRLRLVADRAAEEVGS